MVDHDYYAEYAAIRGAGYAHKFAELHELEMPAGAKQPCNKFGLHPKLSFLKESYDLGDLALVANAGALTEPLTMTDWKKQYLGTKRFPPGLFAHNVMQKNAQTVHADEGAAKGVLGRMVASLSNSSTPMKSAMYSMSGYSRMLAGAITPNIIDRRDGVVRFGGYTSLAQEISALSANESRSHFAESYSAVLQSSLASTEELGRKLRDVKLQHEEGFNTKSVIGTQLREVARVMKLDTAAAEGMERAAFFTNQNGYDTHSVHDISAPLEDLDKELKTFKAEMVEQGLWDSIAIVCVSEFGRTLTTNGQGTDHGWGGNYWILGGDVKGRQMLGKFPTRLTEFVSEVNIGRGRLLPTTPWESVFKAVSEWWGIEDPHELAKVLPHAANFGSGTLFSRADLFEPAKGDEGGDP